MASVCVIAIYEAIVDIPVVVHVIFSWNNLDNNKEYVGSNDMDIIMANGNNPDNCYVPLDRFDIYNFVVDGDCSDYSNVPMDLYKMDNIMANGSYPGNCFLPTSICNMDSFLAR